MADQLFSPTLDGGALLLAVGIVGATRDAARHLPALGTDPDRVRGANEGELTRIQRFERIDVLIAIVIAGLVNLAMLSIFAARFFGTDADSIEDAYHGLYADPGKWAAIPALGIALPRLRALLVLGRDARRPGRDARVHPAPDSGVRAPRDHGGAGADRRDRRRRTRPVRSCSARSFSFGIPFALVPLVMFTRQADGDGRAREQRPRPR